MSAVATINIDYAKIADFDQPIPLDQKPLNPITIAQYCLYNREFADFKLNDNSYLSYEGGFITENDKISFKNSDFTVRKETSSPSSAGGNLSVSGNSTFFGNINLKNEAGQIVNTVKNIRRLNNLSELNSSTYNNDPIAIGDYKKFFQQPGMITWYNGTYENLVNNMPYWRVCAPPDAGSSVAVTYADGSTGTVVVPNLFGKFIPGAVPSDLTSSLYKTGSTGGVDAVRLSLNQIPAHTHSVVITVTGTGGTSFTGSTGFFSGGGTVTPRNDAYARSCLFRDYSCSGCSCASTVCQTAACVAWSRTTSWACRRECRRVGRGQVCNNVCSPTGSRTFCTQNRPAASNCFINVFSTILNSPRVARTMLTSITVSAYKFRRLKLAKEDPRVDTQTEDTVGGNLAHENRPRFFGLIPIIYVGVAR